MESEKESVRRVNGESQKVIVMDSLVWPPIVGDHTVLNRVIRVQSPD